MAEPLLSGKVILVTGSASGIGEAIARRAVEEGARVMIHGLEEQDARRVAESLGDAAGYVGADLEDEEAPERIIAATIARFGRIDGLVNNAALMNRSNLDSTSGALFDLLMRVNVRAPLLLIKAALPHFRAQGRGVVLNIGSVNAHCGEPNLLVYSMTKGALMTMTRNLADAHAVEGIRVNQLNVGWTLTENERRQKEIDGLGPDWETSLPKLFAPSGRIFRPHEIAAHAVFWLSDATGPVTGTVYEIEQHPIIGRNPDKVLFRGA